MSLLWLWLILSGLALIGGVFAVGSVMKGGGLFEGIERAFWSLIVLGGGACLVVAGATVGVLRLLGVGA